MISKSIDIMENVPLADMTTFGVGGPARYFARVSSEADIAAAFSLAREMGLDYIVLGGGSNVLISDEGFPGLVILNRITGFHHDESDDRITVRVGGGEDWQEFADRCVDRGWQGVECLAGIPGTVGACPIQNVGAYGQEVSQVISRVECLEAATGNTVLFGNEECAFGYRESIFNRGQAGKYIVTSVTFNLVKGGSPVIKYRELEERLSATTSPTLTDVRDAVLTIRSGKGLVVRGGYESFRSAGSFFKNPIVTRREFEQIESLFASHDGPKNWAWPLPDGNVKVLAACLIQQSGFDRGAGKGKVGISPRHTLVLINRGGASARQIVDFAAEVRRRVFERFGAILVPEARLIGFESSPFNELPQNNPPPSSDY